MAAAGQTTELHRLCGDPSVTLKSLKKCATTCPDDIKTADPTGSYPLHVFGNNQKLMSKLSSSRSAAAKFCRCLIHQCPRAAVEEDSGGFIPFAQSIEKWISTVKHKLAEETSEQAPAANICPWKLDKSFVAVPRHVECCLSMLSIVLEVLASIAVEGCNSTTANRSGRDAGSPQDIQTPEKTPTGQTPVHREALIDKFKEKLPDLFWAVLWYDDRCRASTREHLWNENILRPVLLCPDWIGSWLVKMLNTGGTKSKRAVDFLCYISHTSIEGHKCSWRPSQELIESETKRQETLFDAVAKVEGIMASLVTLDTEEEGRAISTACVSHMIKKTLEEPFALGLLLLDFMLHIVVMMAFRPIATLKAEWNPLPLRIHASVVIFVIVVHFLLRKICELAQVYWTLKSLPRAFYCDIWIVFDLVAAFLTVAASICHTISGFYHSGLNSLVIGLLWIKVLAYLKVVNKELSTFILALPVIIYDIRLFMVVLGVCVIMFADMFFVFVSTKDNGEFCANLFVDDHEAGTLDDFCYSHLDSYLRVYSILLGNFELESMTETLGTTILFLIFSVFGVIILLNVLIAIISDSYAKAVMNGVLLFGRARVLYVAQIEALETFLKHRPIDGKLDCRKGCEVVTRWFVLGVIVLTAYYALLFMATLAFIFGTRKLWFRCGITVLLVIFPLFCAIMVVQTSAECCVGIGWIAEKTIGVDIHNQLDAIGSINNWIVRKISHFLFGLGKKKGHTLVMNGQVEEEWNNKVKYLESVIERMREVNGQVE